jgi:tRNA-Thr(GGU) m(6)t(6)A37 methyltransferase TsaA
MSAGWSFEPIGTLTSCYREKFGIPRQPGLVPGARGVLKLRDEPFLRQALRGIEGFSHLWIVFVFHRHDARAWKPSIRPPRLGGERKVGVLASRSPHRPNPIGISVVRLAGVQADAPGGAELTLEGVDLLDGTPVLDIKPYLAYADSVPEASAGWADEPIERFEVRFEPEALREVRAREAEFPGLEALIRETLALDPRPAFQKRRFPPASPEAQGTRYGFALGPCDVQWEIREGCFVVVRLAPEGQREGEGEGEGGGEGEGFKKNEVRRV